VEAIPPVYFLSQQQIKKPIPLLAKSAFILSEKRLGFIFQ